MDYEKNKEALAIVEQMVADGQISQDVVEKYFPELKESEDEKIRQFFIHEVEGTSEEIMSYRGMNKESVLAWLKKQGEQKPIENINGEDYGIDGLWHAQRILERTLGEVEGYQSDDGILEHKCAIAAVKELSKQKSSWSEEDEDILNTIINHFKVDIECTDEDDMVRWLKSVKDRILSQSKQEQNK